MTSRSWQHISCYWDACSNYLVISDFRLSISPKKREYSLSLWWIFTLFKPIQAISHYYNFLQNICLFYLGRKFMISNVAPKWKTNKTQSLTERKFQKQIKLKNVLFPGHNHLLTTGVVDQTLWLWCSGDNQSVGSSAPVVIRWLAGAFNLCPISNKRSSGSCFVCTSIRLGCPVY